MLSAKLTKMIQIAIPDKTASAELIADLNAELALSPAADVAAVSAPNATDLASAETLANANKVAINAILANLKAAGLML
jgi:hypothetical protein